MASRSCVHFMVSAIVLTFSPMTTLAQQEVESGGVGIGLRQAEDGRVLIERVAPDGAGAQVGLQVGDWLAGVNRRAVAELNGAQLVEAIRGPVGSKVELVYVRGNADPVAVAVTRVALGNGSAPSASASRPVTQSSSSTVPSTAAMPAPPGAPMKFTEQTVKDPAANNIAALTFLLPKG